MNYALGYAFSMNQMFMNFPFGKLKTHWTEIKRLFGECGKMTLVIRVFIASIQIILKDIIENNVIFELPTGAKKADIRVSRITGDDFIRARKNRKFMDVDFLESNFTGHQLVLNMYTKGYYRTKPVYVNHDYRDRLTELTNQGKQYG